MLLFFLKKNSQKRDCKKEKRFFSSQKTKFNQFLLNMCEADCVRNKINRRQSNKKTNLEKI